jgi:hypothetical protein
MPIRFTDSNTNKISIKLEVRARVPGSTDQGNNAAKENLITTQFEIKIADQTTVNACLANKLSIADNSYYYPDINRDDLFYFDVAPTDFPSEPTIIPGRKLVTTAPESSECWITTTLEIFMPNEWNEEEGY